MVLGSSRLISVRESPNVRRSYDGVRGTWSEQGHLRIDGFYLRPVTPDTGTFADRSSWRQRFWGLYATTDHPVLMGLAAHLYYLGYKNDDARFAAGRAHELRHTVGTRLFGTLDKTDLNFEGAWQWGTCGSGRIRAWAVSADIGYTFEHVRFAPRVGLKADAVSGDRDLHDRTLGTFNALFPKLPYFSEANLVAPANLLDVQPNVRLRLPRRTTLTLSWNPLWKEERQDAYYAPPLSPVAGTTHSSARYIGQQVDALVEWKATDHLSLSGTYVYFEPGGVTRDAGGRSGSFGAAWIQYTF